MPVTLRLPAVLSKIAGGRNLLEGQGDTVGTVYRRRCLPPSRSGCTPARCEWGAIPLRRLLRRRRGHPVPAGLPDASGGWCRNHRRSRRLRRVGMSIGRPAAELPQLAQDEILRYGRSAIGLNLAAAGVGRLGIVEFATIDVTNLQRQVLHGTRDVGRKVAHANASTTWTPTSWIMRSGSHRRTRSISCQAMTWSLTGAITFRPATS